MVVVPGIRSDYNLIGLKESKYIYSSHTAEDEKAKTMIPDFAQNEVATIS